MATRDIISYVRVEASESYLVDKDNNMLLAPKYPVIYYTENPQIKIRPLKDDGTPYALSDFSGYDSWEFGIDNDWDQDTSPVVYAQSATTTFTVQEVVVDSTTYVEIQFLADANTASFETDIGVLKEIRTGVYAELCAFNSGTTTPQLIIQFPFILRNKLVDVTGGIPSGAIDNYYTKSQADVIFEKQVKTSQVTITDDSANNIVLGSTVFYRSISIEGVIQDSSDNYNRITGYVTHDGTVATAYIDQDDMGGTMIATLTYTADISNSSMRLIITAASVGVNPIMMWGITNYTADSNYTFIPTEISGLVAWWDASQITTLNNNDDVTTWIDVTGVYSATQSVAAKKPHYKTNQINSLAAIDFEADDSQYLITTITPSASKTVFVVFTCESLADRVLVGSTDTSDDSFIGIETATDKLAGGVSTDDITTILGTTTIATDGTAYIGMLKYNGSNVNLALDGTVEYAGAQAAAISNSQVEYIGANNIDASPSAYWDGLIGEIIIYNTSLSSTDTANIVAYLQNKWSIS
jgi:hypothetical protein